MKRHDSSYSHHGMIFHRRIGMRDRDIIETVIAGSLACPRQQFEIHHIIDDNRILPFTIIGKSQERIALIIG